MGLRLIVVAGALLLLGYVGLFLLLESPTMWVHPALVQDRWPEVFEPLLGIFPQAWLEATRTSSIGLLNACLYFAILAWLFGVYIFALRLLISRVSYLWAADGRAFRLIMAFSAMALLILIFVRGTFSTDIINYAWYGRIFAIFGGNPYIDVASDYAAVDAGGWLQYGIWEGLPSVYGPVWVMLAGAVAWVAQVGDGSIVNHILGHRLLADAAHLANIWLVWRVAELVIARYWRAPALPEGTTCEAWRIRARVAVTLAYAWNPLLIIEFGVSGHNDLLLVMGVLVAIWLHLAGRWRLATLALTLAVLVKLPAIIFLAAYLWLLFWRKGEESEVAPLQERVWRVGQAILITVVIGAAFFAPFWEGPATLEAFSNNPGATSFNHSLGKILVFKVPEGVSQAALASGLQPASSWELNSLRAAFDPYVRWGLRIILVAFSLWVLWRARQFRLALPAWCLVMFAYLTVGAFWFWPWYVSWLIGPAVLVGPGRLLNAALLLCASSLTLYALFPVAADPLSPLVGWTGLVNMLPPLAYILLSRRPLFQFWSIEKE